MPRAASGLLLITAAALLIVRVGTITQDWRDSGHDHEQLVEAFESLQEKSRILPYVVNEGSQEFLGKPPMQHLASTAGGYSSVRVRPDFVQRPGYAAGWNYGRVSGARERCPGDIAPKKPFLKPLDDPDNPLSRNSLSRFGFDYVLLFAMKPLSFAIPSSFREVAGGDKFILYRFDP